MCVCVFLSVPFSGIGLKGNRKGKHLLFLGGGRGRSPNFDTSPPGRNGNVDSLGVGAAGKSDRSCTARIIP